MTIQDLMNEINELHDIMLVLSENLSKEDINNLEKEFSDEGKQILEEMKRFLKEKINDVI